MVLGLQNLGLFFEKGVYTFAFNFEEVTACLLFFCSLCSHIVKWVMGFLNGGYKAS